MLKVVKFQLPPPKRLSTVVKNIFCDGGGGGGSMLNRVNSFSTFFLKYNNRQRKTRFYS